MNLTLKEVAALLGRSPRQLRYLVKIGKIIASKKNGCWHIESTDLPLSESQRERLHQRVNEARDIFDQALEPVDKAASSTPREKKEGKHYSVTDFKAFQDGESIYKEMTDSFGQKDVACRHLFDALCQITQGCHAFHPQDKCARFTSARESAALAVTTLLLEKPKESGHRKGFAQRIEQELIPKIARLLATHERRSRSSRFSSFGSNTFMSRVSQ